MATILQGNGLKRLANGTLVHFEMDGNGGGGGNGSSAANANSNVATTGSQPEPTPVFTNHQLGNKVIILDKSGAGHQPTVHIQPHHHQIQLNNRIVTAPDGTFWIQQPLQIGVNGLQLIQQQQQQQPAAKQIILIKGNGGALTAAQLHVAKPPAASLVATLPAAAQPQQQQVPQPPLQQIIAAAAPPPPPDNTTTTTTTTTINNTTSDDDAPVDVQQQQQSDEPEVDIVINNVVCSFSVRCHLNLRQIALTGCNVEYRRENGMVTMKLRRPYTTASIWSSGKITCTGATTEDESKVAARRYARALQKLGFSTKFSNFRVVNVLGTCSMPFAIKITSFSERYKEAEYEPELHPGVTFKMKKPKATLKIFSTGSITVTAPSVSEVQKAIEAIYPMVYEFRKERSSDEAGSSAQRKHQASGGKRQVVTKEEATAVKSNNHLQHQQQQHHHVIHDSDDDDDDDEETTTSQDDDSD